MTIEMVRKISDDSVMAMGIVSAEAIKIGDEVTVVSDTRGPVRCRISGIEIFAPDQGHAFDMTEAETAEKGKPAGLILSGPAAETIAVGDRMELVQAHGPH